MHKANMPAGQATQALHWYYEMQENTLADQERMDNDFLTESEDALRAEWGPQDYRRNINLIKGLVDTMPEGLQEGFVGARLADGRALMNTPEMARWLVGISRQINPVSTVVPGAGVNAPAVIEDEIASIEKVMREDRAQYNQDPKMQARLRELYAARERVKA